MTFDFISRFQARGIDIPMLDNVINYDFPAKPKLFVHRVGECSLLLVRNLFQMLLQQFLQAHD